MKRVEILRTYLELADPASCPAPESPDPRSRVERVLDCPASFFRYLYVEVGRGYHWRDRLGWTDEQILEAIAYASLESFTAMVNVAGEVPVDGSSENTRQLRAA